MSGVQLRVTLKDDASPAFRRLQQLAADPRQLMAEIGQTLVTNRQLRFETGTGPDRKPWKPSMRAKAGIGQTLVGESRQLMLSVVRQEPKVSGNSVMISTDVPYAAVHEFGATIRPVRAKALRFALPGGGFATVKQAVIPARPFMAFDRDDREDVMATVREHIDRLSRGGARA